MYTLTMYFFVVLEISPIYPIVPSSFWHCFKSDRYNQLPFNEFSKDIGTSCLHLTMIYEPLKMELLKSKECSADHFH